MKTLCMSGNMSTGGQLHAYDLLMPLLFSEADVHRALSIMRMGIDHSTYETVVMVTTEDLIDFGRASISGATVRWATLATCMDHVIDVARRSGVQVPAHLDMMVSEMGPRLLTHRELQILRLIATGNSIKEISYTLGISHHTVTTHKRNLYLKTGAHTMQQLALFAVLHLYGPDQVKSRLVSPPEGRG